MSICTAAATRMWCLPFWLENGRHGCCCCCCNGTGVANVARVYRRVCRRVSRDDAEGLVWVLGSQREGANVRGAVAPVGSFTRYLPGCTSALQIFARAWRLVCATARCGCRAWVDCSHLLTCYVLSIDAAQHYAGVRQPRCEGQVLADVAKDWMRSSYCGLCAASGCIASPNCRERSQGHNPCGRGHLRSRNT